MMEFCINEWLTSARVLLIEDDDMVLRALKTAFEYSGCSVEAALTAEEGIELLGGADFDLILCDYQLPGMNGAQFFIASRALTVNSIKILMSAFGFGDLGCHPVAGGIDAFFEKPFSIQALFNNVASIKARIGRTDASKN